MIRPCDIRVGDMIRVRATGRKERKVVSVHDTYAMVERTWYPRTNPGKTPAKIYFTQISTNLSNNERIEQEYEFEGNLPEFELLIDAMACDRL